MRTKDQYVKIAAQVRDVADAMFHEISKSEHGVNGEDLIRIREAVLNDLLK